MGKDLSKAKEMEEKVRMAGRCPSDWKQVSICRKATLRCFFQGALVGSTGSNLCHLNSESLL